MHTLRWLVFQFTLTLAAGCMDADELSQDTPGVVRRDSAGVSIVQNSAPSWALGQGWTVASEPALRIGSVSGAAGTDFRLISFATALSDGSIIVVDPTLPAVRRFSSTGQFLNAIGSAGDGPGELRGIGGWARIRGDSIALHDPSNGRLSVFSADGSLGRLSVVPATACFACVGWFRNGSVLVHGPIRRSTDDPEFRETLWQRPHGADSLAPYATLIMDWEPERGVTAAPTLRMSWAFADSTFWYGFPDRLEVRELALDGRLLRIFRTTEVAEAVPDILAEHYRRDADQRGSTVNVSPYMPIFDGIFIDFGNNLWLRRAPSVAQRLSGPWTMQPLVTVDSNAARQWIVLNSAGEWLGEVTTPTGLNVFEIGRDYVLGTTRDQFEVPYVQLHILSKP